MHLYIHEEDAHLMESFEQYLPNAVRSKEFEHYIVFICNFRNTPDQLKKLPCFGIYKQRYNYHYPTCHGSAWYTTYQSRLHFYRVNGRIVRSFELWAYIFEDDISKLELPKGMPQEIHDKAMEALADTDIEAVLLKIKLGV